MCLDRAAALVCAAASTPLAAIAHHLPYALSRPGSEQRNIEKTSNGKEKSGEVTNG